MQSEKQQAVHKGISITALIIGALFSLFLVVGRSFRYRADFTLVVADPWKSVLFFVLLWIGFTIFLTLLYRGLDLLTDSGSAARKDISHSSGKPGISGKISESTTGSGTAVKDFKRPVLTRMLLLLLMWGLFQIWFLPGNVPADPWRQLNMFLGYSYWHTHHPFVATVTTGSIYWLGMQIGGKNMGTFLCVLVQDLAGSFAFASMIAYVHRRSRSRVLSTICLVFMGVVPLFPAYIMSLGKDSLYLTYLTLFLLSYVKILLKDEDKYTWFVMIFFGAMACMQRHDAIYLIIPTAFALVLMVSGKQMKKRMLIAALLILLAAVSERVFVSRVLGLHSDTQTEALSFPLQQMGRYVTKHEGELTPEEIETIDAVLVYEGIPSRYKPWHSNGIKNYKRDDATKEDWIRFFRLWAKKMAEDPLTYTESAVNSMLGYIDPLYIRSESLDLYNYSADKSMHTFSTYVFPKKVQEAARSYMVFWRRFPVLHPFMAPAFYFWIYIILFGAMIRRKANRRRAWIFVFPLLLFAICIASPISGSTRYSMPVITLLPLYVLLVLENYRNIQPKTSGMRIPDSSGQ